MVNKMRNDGVKFKILILSIGLILGVAGFASNSRAANWSGLLDSSRAIDWSNSGIPGGIPHRTTICSTISASTYGDGSSDATSGIQSALNSCPSGQVVFLSSGNFRISTLNIPSNVTLRGAGPDKTILQLYGSGSAISLGTGMLSCYSDAPKAVSITGGTTAGSTSIIVSSASGISVGSYLYITELNNPNYVSQVGHEGNCSWCDECWSGGRARGQIAEVTSVSGNTIGISPGLYSAYTLTPQAIPFSASVKYSGVEDLQLYARNTGYTGNIFMGRAAYSWIKNVHSNFADGDHVRIFSSYRGEIRDSYFHDASSHTPGQTDACILLGFKTSGFLIENNILMRLHASIMLNWGAAGNVISYNYLDQAFDTNAINVLMFDLAAHGAHPQFNLLEGNVAQHFRPDEAWGSSSHNTFFRSWVTGTTQICEPFFGRGVPGSCHPAVQANRALTIDSKSLYYNIVGAIAGSAAVASQMLEVALVVSPQNRNYEQTAYDMNFGYRGSGGATGDCSSTSTCPAYTTAFIHGVYTNADKNIIWDPSHSNHIIPESFYLNSKPSWFGSTPWPPIGPDVTGGSGPGGHAYMIPAQACYTNTPKDSNGYLVFNANNCYGTGSIPTDTTSPTVSLTAPASGSTVSGSSVTISANASDNVAVAGVQFKLDGANLGSEDTSSPYSISWNTTQASNGSYTLTATARDAVGNQTTSSGITITVNNISSDTQAPSLPANLSATAVSSDQINLTWAASTDNVGVAGYRIYRGGAQIGTSATNSYSNTSLSPSTAYTYTVSAYDAAGNASGQSVSASATTQSQSSSSGDITNGLVGYWKFDEVSGATASDSSGNNNTGTLANGPSWTKGKFGNALNFDGMNDYVDTGSDLFGTGNITVSAWINYAGANPNGVIFGNRSTILNIQTTYNRIGFTSNNGITWLLASPVPLDPNKWGHIAVTRLSDGTATIYANGQAVGSGSSGTPVAGLTNAFIGYSQYQGNLNGLIDETRVYNRALSSSEISQLYNYAAGLADTTPPAAPTGLVVQ